MPINFHSQNIFFRLKNRVSIRKWIIESLSKENKVPGDINFIFCDDAYLFELNKKYLNHNTLTDIITFDYSQQENPKSQISNPKFGHPEPVEGQNPKSQILNPKSISGDIFISIERVKENAKKFNVDFDTELHRVIIHGILHLAGYKDKTKEAKTLMTQKEDFYIHLLKP